MKQKEKVKKQKNEKLIPKQKSEIFFFKKDFLSIIGIVFKQRYGREEFFLKELNSLLSTCLLSSQIKIDRNLLHGKSGLKHDLNEFHTTLDRFVKILKKINQNGPILYYLEGHKKTLKYVELITNTLTRALPIAINNLSESNGVKRGKPTPLHETMLIRGLIVIYEHYTGKKVENNFTQPKVKGVDYSGEFYCFAFNVLWRIDEKFKRKRKQNIFSIELSTPNQQRDLVKKNREPTVSLSLGKRITKILSDQESLMISNLIFDKSSKKLGCSF